MEALIEFLKQFDGCHSVGRIGDTVSARFRKGADMTAFHTIVTDYGYVPMAVHWEDRRVTFHADYEVLE